MIADQPSPRRMGKGKTKGRPTGSAFGAKRIVLLQIGRELKFPRRIFGNFLCHQSGGKPKLLKIPFFWGEWEDLASISGDNMQEGLPWRRLSIELLALENVIWHNHDLRF